MTIQLRPPLETLRRLAAVAQGRQPADLVLTGGAVVNVFTEEVQEGWGLAVADGRVAFVGPDAEVRSRAGAETERVDLAGDLVAPGLIESHTHLTRIRLSDFCNLQVRCGVTTTVLESMELAAVTGAAGFRALLDNASRMPGRLYLTVSPLISGDPELDARSEPEEWASFLDHALVAGVGEIYWGDLLRGRPRTEALIAACLERGLAVEGHGAGARPSMVNALAAFGVGSDHEGIGAADVRDRLRAGLYAMARHGATRQDLPAIADLWRVGQVDVGRLVLVTDGLEPQPLARGASLNRVVELAVELGLPFARAVRLASRNAAERFGLGRWLGGLAPGMVADLVVLPRGGRFRPRLVLVDGRPPMGAAALRWPEWMRETVRLLDGLDADLVAHPGPGRWRAMAFRAPLVTQEAESDGDGDLVCSVVDRTGGSRGFRGLLRGFGLEGGGAALSSGWESTGLLLVGDRPTDMALAARRVRDLGGGAVVAAGGRLLAEWAAPVAGLYSEAPLGQVVDQVAAVNGALRDLGCPLPNPLLSLETLTTAAIPFLRISPVGYFRLRDGARLGLRWS